MENTTNYTISSIGNDSNQQKAVTLQFIGNPRSLNQWILEGPVMMAICIFVTVVNSLFLVVLSKKEMRSVTSFLLSSIAACDLLMAVSGLPSSTYVTISNTNGDPVPYDYCFLVSHRGIIPQISHTASIWLTLTLGVFRCISVCHPLKATTHCSYRRAVKAVIIAVALPIILYGKNFSEVTLRPFNYTKADNVSYSACSFIYPDWLGSKKYQYYYYLGHNAFRAIFVQFLPCVILSIITIRLVWALKSASDNRKNLGTNYQEHESRRTSILLIAVLIAFLVIETPLAFLMLVDVIDRGILTYDKIIFVAASNDTVLLTCAFNFCIHCAMGEKFRQTFRSLCCSEKKPPVRFNDF